ncbi:MAG: ABC transporter ATP-binding protein, partial [Nocardioides sp.]
TLVVVSHDRYFLERVTDSIWALLGDGRISMLPRGVDEYLERRMVAPSPSGDGSVSETLAPAGAPSATPAADARPKAGSAEEREAKKTVARIDKRLEKIAEQEAKLNEQLAAHASDYAKLAELGAELNALAEEKGELELEWLEAAELLG